MDESCPICLEVYTGNKYELNCRTDKSQPAHSICNTCESAMRLATKPETPKKKGETYRKIKCPMCRGVELEENTRSAQSYKKEIESLYLLLSRQVPERRPEPIYTNSSAYITALEYHRQQANRLREERRLHTSQLREAIQASLAPVVPVVPVARAPSRRRPPPAPLVPVTVVPPPVPPAPIDLQVTPDLPLDTGARAIWCFYTRNGRTTCTTKGKTKRKCSSLLADGTACLEKVCRACKCCTRH
jgi:hypothetical protein